MNEKQTAFFENCNSLISILEENPPASFNPNDKDSIMQICNNLKALFINVFGEEVQPRICGWMKDHEFSLTPASARYHGNHKYGLLLHTYLVTYLSLKLAKGVFENYFNTPIADLFDISANDIVVAAVFHDFCKAGTFESYIKKLPNENGDWVPTEQFKTKQGLRNLGHGNESVLILLELLPEYIRNRPVLEAISRHMGFSDLSEYDSFNYSEFLKNPLVLLLQLADQAASAWYNL